MNKTKVDDFLIEMISPKVREIEDKFNSSQALSQDDINTLLLKLLEANVNKNLQLFANKLDGFEQRMGGFEQRIEQRFEAFEHKIEGTIQKALNKNMMLLIGAVGLFMSIFKIIDKF